MTTQGIKLHTSSGTEFFNTDSQTWNYVGSFVAPTTGASAVFPTLDLMGEVIIQRSAVDSPPDNQEGYIHSVSRSGTTISASGGNVRTLVVVLGR